MNYASEPPAGQLRLASSATANFTASLISSIAKTLPSTLFSTGGDEINIRCYIDDAQTQADLKKINKTVEQALDAFTQMSHNALKKIGKTPVVWEGKFRFVKLKLLGFKLKTQCRNGAQAPSDSVE